MAYQEWLLFLSAVPLLTCSLHLAPITLTRALYLALDPVTEQLGACTTFAGQGNGLTSSCRYFGIIGCHPLLDSLLGLHIEAACHAHHHHRLGNAEIGRVAHLLF